MKVSGEELQPQSLIDNFVDIMLLFTQGKG